MNERPARLKRPMQVSGHLASVGRGPRRLAVALATAGALVVTSCGGGSADGVGTAASDPTTTAAASDTTLSSTTSAPPEEAATEEAATDEPADAEPVDEAPVENLFPDVDVVDIDSGETINLAAELGGGDRPVLLWFWAPH